MELLRNRRVINIYAPIISGVLIGLSFPPNPIGSLFIGLGFIPILFVIRQIQTYNEVLRKSYLSMFFYMLLSSWWMGSWQANSDKFLILTCTAFIFLHPLFYLPAFIFYKFLLNKKNETVALLGFALFWCFGEYTHSLSEASYPWLTIGNAHTYNIPFIQFIEYTGVWGLSFITLLQNILIVKMLFTKFKMNDNYAENEKFEVEENYKGTDIVEYKNLKRTTLKAAIMLACTVLLPYVFGYYCLTKDKKNNQKLSVGIVQPNINPWEKWGEASENQIEINSEQTRRVAREYLKQKKKNLDMVLWVETAIPYPLRHPSSSGKLLEMNSFVDSLQIPILSGFADYEVYKNREAKPSSRYEIIETEKGKDTMKYDYFNSVGMFKPTYGIYDIYHKSQLVPFGERIPFIDEFPSLASMLTWGVGISAWGKGDSTKPLKLNDTTKIGAVICIESIYPRLVSEFVKKGAKLLTIVTNDGWYLGTPGPIQHNQFAILRAVENRRAIARAANTGISSCINSDGVILSETQEGLKTELTGELELRDDITLYTKYGDWLPQICGVFSLLILIIGLVRKK